MYQVHYNEEKNRIYMNFKQKISKQEIQKYKGELYWILEGIRPHFTVCVNAAELNGFSPSLYGEFTHLKEYCESSGMRKLAVVIPYKAYQFYRRRLEQELGSIFLKQEDAEAFLDK